MEKSDKFDFDAVWDRRGTDSSKWNSAEVLDENLLPLSVADMDFAVPAVVTQALVARTAMPLYGYEFQPQALKDAIIAWHDRRHGFAVHPDWIVFTPGVVNGLAICILAFTEKGERIAIQPPVYPPFFGVVTENQRQLLTNPLHYDAASLRYTMDFNALEKLFREKKPRLMFLCNPHNPVGRVWTGQELQVLGGLCEKYGVILVSDDIHADLVFAGHRYHPVLGISEALQNNAIQLMSPGKSFNIPGLRFSYALIADGTLRDRFSKKLSALALTQTNIMAKVAAQAAYLDGAPWLDRVLDYIWHNYTLLKTTLTAELPWAKAIPPEGTFLAWLDLSASGFDHHQLSYIVRAKAKLMLYEGPAFGDAGRGFMRINLACPRETLREALKRLVDAFVQAREHPPELIQIMDRPATSRKCCG